MATFYTGEQPSDPLVITVRDAAGNPLDLTDVDSVALLGDDLPAGSLDVSDPATGKVQYTFEAPFTTPGLLQLQVAMTDSGDGVDYSAPFTITVASPAAVADLLVDQLQVETWTTVPVALNDIARAQSDIILVVGRDLTDAHWLSTLVDSDRFWLSMAVAQQAAENALVPVSGTITASTVPGALKVLNGDVRVDFAPEAAFAALNGPVLGVRAAAAVKKLSWMRPTRTLFAKPFLDDRRWGVWDGVPGDMPSMWYEEHP